MKDKTKAKIKRFIPNIPVVRRYFTNSKLRRLRAKLLPESMIKAGETDAGKRREIVLAWSEKWPKYTAILKKQLDDYFVHKPELLHRPDADDLRMDALFNACAYGFEPDEYFYYHLEGKTESEKREYVSDLEKEILTYTLNDVIDIEVFMDKSRTYQKLKPYFKREAVSIEHPRDYQRFLRFIKKHPSFVRKSIGMGRGNGVSKIESVGQDPKELFQYLIGMGKQLLEELVIQAPVVAQFSSASVNTVRCPTFRTARGIELGPCFFRVGQGTSFVDNAGAGGILTNVNPENGILDTNGWDEYCNEYVIHPQSGMAFKGFQLPEWEQLKATVTEMAEIFPNMGYISWDMAYTEHGWVIIEANGAGQLVSQIAKQRGIKRDIEKQLEGVFSF